MVLDILLVWMALAALAVLFMYCCSRVSNGPRRDLTVDELVTEVFHRGDAASTGVRGRVYRAARDPSRTSRPQPEPFPANLRTRSS
jgi:hypothetical protein